MVSAAKRDGRYDAGVADISAGARLLEPEALIWRDPITGARAHAATVEVDRGVSFADALSKLRSWRAAAAAAKRNTDGGDAAADSREGRRHDARWVAFLDDDDAVEQPQAGFVESNHVGDHDAYAAGIARGRQIKLAR